MNDWVIAIIVYTALSIGTFVPALIAIINGVKPHPGGDSFDQSTLHSDEAKVRLTQHFSRIAGTLGFWKKQAEIFKRLHYYTLIWTIPASVLIPFLIQTINKDPASKWFVTIISAHTAIPLAFHKALKVDVNFRTWREAESHFYDLYRRMLDRPLTFGDTEEKQLSAYFDAVENLRMFIRNAEIDNTPSVEEAQRQLSRNDYQRD